MILFALSLADGVVHLDRPVRSIESLPDLFRSRERLQTGGMRFDKASEIDDNRPDVGRLSIGHPHDVPVTLPLQRRVEQVDVLLGLVDHWPAARSIRSAPMLTRRLVR